METRIAALAILVEEPESVRVTIRLSLVQLPLMEVGSMLTEAVADRTLVPMIQMIHHTILVVPELAPVVVRIVKD